MYQGKFDKKTKKTSVDVHELVTQRNAETAAPKEAPAPKKPAHPVVFDQDAGKTPEAIQKETSPKKKTPKKAAPQAEVEEVVEKKRKGPRLGSLIFYTIYFLFIFLFFIATALGMKWISNWLVNYEAAQPTVKAQEVFNYLFTDPDWAMLYDAAGVTDTEYEGKEAFVSYMENKMGQKELEYFETSAGLSTDKKYLVKLEGEKVATFTLTGGSLLKTDIPEWKLGTIELFYEREESFLINSADGYTTYVNGVALDDSFTIQIATTKADTTENFLPAGAASAKTCIQKIDGLMAVPTVTVKNAAGQDVEVTYDEESRTFTAAVNGLTMSDEIKTMALNTLKVYAEYGINEANRNDLGAHFDTNGDAFKGIVGTDRGWTKGNNGYSFTNEAVSGYSVYSDSLFSVYASANMTIKLTDGGTQEKDIHATFLYQKQNGNWKVIRMTNADVSEPVGKVRITFMNEDVVVSSDFYNTDASIVDPPELSVPEGKKFVGWLNKDTSEWYLVFSPDESGVCTIPAGTTLEPMTVHAYFENAE